jgi:glutamyl-tRNA synthetase
LQLFKGHQLFIIASGPTQKLDHIEEKTKAFCKDKNVTFSELVHPMRVALSGKTVTPGIYDVLYLVGKERVIERLKVFSLS